MEGTLLDTGSSPTGLGMCVLSIPEIAMTVYANVDKPTLFAAARVCRGWAAAALDMLWRHPPAAALTAVSADRRPHYAASVRSLSLFTAEQAEAAVHGGWAFPRLRSLVLPCQAVERAPDACRAFVARCAVAPSVLRCMYLTEQAWGQGKPKQFDGRYDVCLAGLLADLAQRRGLEELIVDTAVTERLRIPVIADVSQMATESSDLPASLAMTGPGGHADNVDNSEMDHASAGAATGSVDDVPGAFRDLRRFHVNIIASGGEKAVLPPVLLLRSELLGAVTYLSLDLGFSTDFVGSAFYSLSRLSTLRLLKLGLPMTCRIDVDQFMALSRLVELRHLFVEGAQYGIRIDYFPDDEWTRFAQGLRRLRSLGITPCMGLSPNAVRILGTACRELTEVVMIKHCEDLESLPPVHSTTPATAMAATYATATADRDGAPLFPQLETLNLDGVKLTFNSLGLYAATAEERAAAVEERATALVARLREHAPKLSQFCFLSHGELDGLVEAMMHADGIGHCPMVTRNRRLAVLGREYWDQLYPDRSDPTIEWYGCGYCARV